MKNRPQVGEKKNILKIKFSKQKLRKFFFSTSLTTFLRWTMAENARGAQYQPCRDVTFLDFHENRLRTHVEISRKNAISFFVFRFRRQKESYSTPLDLPVTPVCLNTINCFKKFAKKKHGAKEAEGPSCCTCI